MHRRIFITALGVSALGIGLPTTAPQSKHCKIIGIGGAGCNFIDAFKFTGTLSPALGWTTELIGIDADSETVREFIATFAAWLFDADVVVLVAGLSGSTGSRVLSAMAKLAKETGAFVIAAVIMPFDLEGSLRTLGAATALHQIEQEADVVLHFSNQTLLVSLGDIVSLDELFLVQDRRMNFGINGVLDHRRRYWNHRAVT
jgi:cell division protein FtsZ